MSTRLHIRSESKARAEKSIIYRDRLRREVFDLLGLRCSCCQEWMIEFLQIDHIKGDGAQHRRSVRSQTTFFNQILRDQDRASKYRLLCANCHFAISYRGGCPHGSAKPLGLRSCG